MKKFLHLKHYKKALFFTIIFAIIFVMAILPMALNASFKKESTFKKYIGETQMTLLKTYEKGEKILFIIDQISNMALKKTIFNLAEKGFLYDERCGSYYGYNLWTTEDKDCFPDDKDIITEFQNVQKEYFKNFNIPLIDYEYLVFQDEDLTIKGISKKIIKTSVSENVDIILENIVSSQGIGGPSQTCISNCKGKTCGSDGCGGSCGECDSDKICSPYGECVKKENIGKGKCDYLVNYADLFVGCPYRLWCHTYPPGCVVANPKNCYTIGLTCASFVTSVIAGKTSVPSFPGNGDQKCSVNRDKVIMLGTNVNNLQPGDIFQAGKVSPGHTGMYVGKGFVSGEITYFGIRKCYKHFTPNPNGKHIFIHSIGNQDQGKPGVCYEPYEQLFAPGRHQVTQFCRLKICA